MLVTLIFCPLAFGSVEPWALFVMQMLAGGYLLLVLLVAWSKGTWTPVPGALPLGLILCLVLAQLIPLPPSLLRALSPTSAALYNSTVYALSPGAWTPLSIYPRETLFEFLRLASYAAIYIGAAQVLSSEDNKKGIATVVVAFALALALLAIAQHFLSPDRLLFFRPLTQGGTPMGPYVNHNHFAGLMGMVLPLALAIGFAWQRKGATSLALPLAAITVICASIVLSHSRSGLIFAYAAAVLFALLALAINARRAFGMISALCVAGLSVGLLRWKTHVLDVVRLYDYFELSRVQYTLDSLKIAAAYPAFGTGVGSFVRAYPMHASTVQKATLNHAHNDYAQMLATGGVIWTGLWIWFFMAITIAAFRAARSTPSAEGKCITIGAAAGVGYMLMHCATDFNLQIGANGLYFSFMVALAVASPGALMPARPWRLFALACMVAIYIGAAITINTGALLASKEFNKVRSADLANPSADVSYIHEVSSRASSLDPLNGTYAYALGNTSYLLGNTQDAIGHYARALRLDPTNPEFMERTGWVLDALGRPDKAGLLMRSSAAVQPLGVAYHKSYARWLVKHFDIRRLKKLTIDSITKFPESTVEFVEIMRAGGLSDDDIWHMLPPVSKAFALYGSMLASSSQEQFASRAYQHALELAELANLPLGASPYDYSAVYYFYYHRGRVQEALQVAELGVKRFPAKAGLWVLVGDANRALRQHEAALAAYQRALGIDPQNEAARKGSTIKPTKEPAP